MSEHVQTCLNLVRFNIIWIVTMHIILEHIWTCWNLSKLVQIQHDMNCYNSWFSKMSKMIQIDTILKHFKTWNQNMMKYSNIWANGTKNVWRQSDSLDRCEQVERSKIKDDETNKLICNITKHQVCNLIALFPLLQLHLEGLLTKILFQMLSSNQKAELMI